MKKLFTLTLILSFLYTANICLADAEEVYINIGLFYGNSAKTSVDISYDDVSLTVNAESIAEDTEYGSNTVITIDSKNYRGNAVLKKNEDGKITVINRVNLEDYVASVTAVEMSPSFNIEALKAQAICARTYAKKNMGKHKKYGFDLCAGTDCQAYNGISSESETTNRAAYETAGIYITYDGQPIDAVYSATSGGHTEDVKNVWGSDIPYLSAVEDEYESPDVYGSSWTKELSVEKATEIMNKKGYGLGNITSIEVMEKTENGAVTKLKVTGTEGEKTFKNEGCRLAFGSVVLSQAFTVSPTSIYDEEQPPLYTYDGKQIKGTVALLSGGGTVQKNLDNITLIGNTTRFYQSIVSGAVTGFLFDGRGYGHLVGLSQNGANGMAAAGFTYDQILKHYYKGIELN